MAGELCNYNISSNVKWTNKYRKNTFNDGNVLEYFKRLIILLTCHFSSKDNAGRKVFHFIVLIDSKDDIFILLKFTIAALMALKIALEI